MNVSHLVCVAYTIVYTGFTNKFFQPIWWVFFSIQCEWLTVKPQAMMLFFEVCASLFARLSLNEIHFCLHLFCYHNLHDITIANSFFQFLFFLSFAQSFLDYFRCLKGKKVLRNLRRVGSSISNIFLLSNQWGHKDLLTFSHLMIAFICCCR